MKNRIRFASRLLPTVLGLCCALAEGCGRAPVAAASHPRRVLAAPVAVTRDLPPIEAPGVLSRKLEAMLAFKIGGVVDSVRVRAGESVKRGQVLAQLNLSEIDAQVAQARAAAEKARRDEGRIGRLEADRAATLEQLQNAATGVEAAEAALRIAEFNRLHATILAPADGRILSRMAEPNELVAPGQPVLGFGGDAEGWIFRAGVIESDARRLAKGDPARLHFGGPPDVELPAHVAEVAEAADPRTRTFEIELAVDGEPGGLRSGAVGDLVLAKPGSSFHPRVPASALIEGDGRQAVLFLLQADEGTVHRRSVDVLALWGGSALLADPLPDGAKVIAQGAEYLHDGETVDALAP
jgi:RND family efflux transporter MFP subunit